MLSLLNRGVKTVYVSDISDEKRAFALKHGAAGTVNPLNEDLYEKIMAETGRKGIDAVFVCVPVPPVLNQSLSVVKKKGKVVVIAVFEGAADIAVKSLQMEEKVLLGSNMYTIKDYRNAIEDYRSGKMKLSPLITRRIKFEELGQVIDRLANGELQDEIKIQVLFPD